MVSMSGQSHAIRQSGAVPLRDRRRRSCSTDRSRRGAAYFLCFAKESRQRKATARGRPSASLALQGTSGPCAKLARSRLCRAAGSDTRPALPRCCPAPRRRPRAEAHRRGGGRATRIGPRNRRAAQGGPGPSAIDCSKHVARAAGARSCEFRWPPGRSSSTGNRCRRRLRGRAFSWLLLLAKQEK
jgi:hypothetical protein